MFELTTQNINFDVGPDAVRSNIQSSIESALSIARMSDYELNLQLLENDSATSQPTKDDGTLVHGVLVLAKEKGHALELVEEGYFTVNNTKITVRNSDSLGDVLAWC